MITIIENVIGLAINEYDEVFERAAAAIRRGGIVAFPTETVYGLGGSAISERAIHKIYAAKGRPPDNPLIVHIGHPDQMDGLVTEVSSNAKLLMEHFWPGPLTLVFKKRDIVPDIMTGGLDTVAVRIPSNPIARDLIQRSELPIAAPSANLSGRPSPTNAYHVLEDLNSKIDMIIDGGSTEYGLESTIVDVSGGRLALLRPGAVTLEMLENIVGELYIPETEVKSGDRPIAPGMKYTHYSPAAKVTVINGSIDKIPDKILELVEVSPFRTGIMATDQTLHKYLGCENVFSVGDRLDTKTIAANLFDTLRRFDYCKVQHVFAEGIGSDGLGLAIMNRLKKASGYDIINL